MTSGFTDLGTPLPWHAAWKSHRGHFRKNNEDFVVVGPLGGVSTEPKVVLENVDGTSGEGALIAIVCDGVGGGAAGEIASAEAARVFEASLSTGAEADSGEDFMEKMRTAVAAAHAHLLALVAADQSLEGFGTTMTALVVVRGRAFVLQVGDSRLYRRRGWSLKQLSRDQSFVGTLRQTGHITEDQARHHPLRNMIDQVVGGSAEGVAAAIEVFKIEGGDEFLLCSDGLSDALRDQDIAKVLVEAAHRPVRECVDCLMTAALDQSGRDNISAVVVRIGAERAGMLGSLAARTMFAWKKRRPADQGSRISPDTPSGKDQADSNRPPEERG